MLFLSSCFSISTRQKILLRLLIFLFSVIFEPYTTSGSLTPVRSGGGLLTLPMECREAVPAIILLPSPRVFPVDGKPWSVPPDRFLRSSNRRIRSQTDLPALFSHPLQHPDHFHRDLVIIADYCVNRKFCLQHHLYHHRRFYFRSSV